MTTAIMVDGGLYLKRTETLFGTENPKERPKELDDYIGKPVEASLPRLLL